MEIILSFTAVLDDFRTLTIEAVIGSLIGRMVSSVERGFRLLSEQQFRLWRSTSVTLFYHLRLLWKSFSTDRVPEGWCPDATSSIYHLPSTICEEPQYNTVEELPWCRCACVATLAACRRSLFFASIPGPGTSNNKPTISFGRESAGWALRVCGTLPLVTCLEIRCSGCVRLWPTIWSRFIMFFFFFSIL